MAAHLIVPDIHADMARLDASLKHASCNGMTLFLGDFIDAGKDVSAPADAMVLEKVRGLIEENRAMAVMGNHELNAIMFHSRNAQRQPIRKHSAENCRQHRSFIDAFGIHSENAIAWTDWFLKKLPLWIEIDGLRLVHACWSERCIQEIKKRRPDGYLMREDLPEVADESTPFGRAVKTILTGPEVRLPKPYTFKDFLGKKRNHVRLAWWNTEAKTWPEAALSVPDLSDLPTGLLPSDAVNEIYSTDAPPVLVGHYKMTGIPMIAHKKAASIDYPKAPCIYYWSGEKLLSQGNLRNI